MHFPVTAQLGTAATKPQMPRSGSARRRAKANRNRRNVAALTCKVHGHVLAGDWVLCVRCGTTDPTELGTTSDPSDP